MAQMPSKLDYKLTKWPNVKLIDRDLGQLFFLLLHLTSGYVSILIQCREYLLDTWLLHYVRSGLLVVHVKKLKILRVSAGIGKDIVFVTLIDITYA